MTEGGNKIPTSYLKRFLPSQDQHEGLPTELRLFLDHIGDDDEPKGYEGKEYNAENVSEY